MCPLLSMALLRLALLAMLLVLLCSAFPRTLEFPELEASHPAEPYRRRVVALLHAHPVLAFTRSYCEESRRTTALLRELELPFYEMVLDKDRDGPYLHHILAEASGQTDTPYVFVREKYVGNYEQVWQAYTRGQLNKADEEEAPAPAVSTSDSVPEKLISTAEETPAREL
eukprot:RCo051435